MSENQVARSHIQKWQQLRVPDFRKTGINAAGHYALRNQRIEKLIYHDPEKYNLQEFNINSHFVEHSKRQSFPRFEHCAVFRRFENQ